MLALMADTTILKLFLPQQRMCSYAYMIQMPMPERVCQECYIPAYNHQTQSVSSIVVHPLKFCFPHQGCQYWEVWDIVWHAIPNLGGTVILFAPSSISPFELSEFAISADIMFNLLWLCVL